MKYEKQSAGSSAPPADQIRKPWLRLPGEGQKAYAACKLYYEMGPQRNLDAVAKTLGRERSQIGHWSGRYHWVERADAYLDCLAAIEQEEVERLARQDAAKWKQRERAVAEKKWAISSKWLETSELAEKIPVVERTIVTEAYEDGRPKITHILKPLKRDPIRYAQAGFALGAEAIRETGAKRRRRSNSPTRSTMCRWNPRRKSKMTIHLRAFASASRCQRERGRLNITRIVRPQSDGLTWAV
jgi:hypothetical protein